MSVSEHAKDANFVFYMSTLVFIAQNIEDDCKYYLGFEESRFLVFPKTHSP